MTSDKASLANMPCLPPPHDPCPMALRLTTLRWALADVAALAHDLHRAGRISPADADRIAALCDAPPAGDFVERTTRGPSGVREGVPEPGPYAVNGHVTVDLHH